MPSPPPSAAIVVVTYNSRAHFPALKAALEAQTSRFELWVVDNCSRASECPKPGDFPAGAHIVQLGENIGFAAANNYAVERTTTQCAALLNPDAFPAPDWLEKLIEAAERRPEAGCIASLLLMADDDGRYDGVGDCLHACGASWRGARGRTRREGLREGYVFSACAAAALYRVEAWRALGGFDPAYFCYHEDTDLGFRLRLAGWETVLAPGAIARHVGGGGSHASADFAAYHSTRNGIWTFYKNMPTPLLLALAPLQLAWCLYLLWSALLHGRAGAIAQAMRDAVVGMPEAWAKRRAIQRARRANWLATARALTWSPLAIALKPAKIRALRQDRAS